MCTELKKIVFPDFSFGCLCLFADAELKKIGSKMQYADIEPVTELKI